MVDNNHLLNYFSIDQLQEIKDIKNMYFKALKIIVTVFNGQVDKAGKPYVYHLYRVANSLSTMDEKTAGLLHDIVEDTDITFEDLLNVGFPNDIIEIVKLVTKQKIDKSNMSLAEKLELYNDEIDGIINSGNDYALNLKCADMSDNYNPDRLQELSIEKQEWFHKKYGKQLIKLREEQERRQIK